MFSSVRGWAFTNEGTPEFEKIKTALLDKVGTGIEVEGEKQQAEILGWIKNDPDTFCERFSPLNGKKDHRYEGDNNLFLQGPALAKIDAEEFFQAFLCTPNEHKRGVFGVLKSRANWSDLFGQELPFYKKLNSRVEAYLNDGSKMTPSRMILRDTCRSALSEAIGYLESRTRSEEV